MKRINIAIKEKMHLRIKVASAIREEAMNDYILRAIKEQVERDKAIIKWFGLKMEMKLINISTRKCLQYLNGRHIVFLYQPYGGF